jgi:predicted membrane-bound spermidine synthase
LDRTQQRPDAPGASAYAGVFLLTLATLTYEIALTRIFSVTMWYHFAFVSISIALFGLTIGALIVHNFPNRFPASSVHRQLFVCSLLFGLSIVPCLAIQLLVKFVPELNVSGLLSVLATCSVISVPFVFSGIAVTLALTRFPRRVNRLYAADLVGASAGCALVVYLLNRFDAPTVIIVIGAIGALSALCFAVHSSGRRRAVISAVALATASVLALGALAGLNSHLYHQDQALLRVRWLKGASDPHHHYTTWNAISRLTVDPAGPRQAGIVIDGTAGTQMVQFDGDVTSVAYLRDYTTYLAHYVRPHADVAVVGSGGGADVLAALVFNDHSVRGIEINPGILRIVNHVYGGFTGHLDRNPRVRFVNDEARSYLARDGHRYDIIQISLIDTWAAEAAGAYSLSENGLYTTHAWDIFFHRLKPGGVLSVSRFYTFPGTTRPLEMYRTTALAAQVLRDHGVRHIRDHLLIYRGPVNAEGVALATLLVSPQRFTAQEQAAVAAQAARTDNSPVLTPQRATDERFAALAGPAGPQAGVSGIAEDISPPTDDHPFFFQMANLHTFVSGSNDSFATRPVFVLLLLAIAIVMLALGFIVLPLLVTSDRAAHGGMAPYYTYFAAIGLGFLLIEVSQLQRLSIFLGNPTFGLSVVLFSVLLFSGIGSFMTERFVQVSRPMSMIIPLLVLLMVVVVFGAVTPAVTRHFESATTPMRVLVSIALLAPISIPMGMPFVIGMRAATLRPGAPTSLLWGINGATSVCASVIGVLLAIWFHISTAFWVGAVSYAVALAVLAMIVTAARRSRTPTAAVRAGRRAPDPVPSV